MTIRGPAGRQEFRGLQREKRPRPALETDGGAEHFFIGSADRSAVNDALSGLRDYCRVGKNGTTRVLIDTAKELVVRINRSPGIARWISGG